MSDLEALKARMSDCKDCGLCDGRTNVVFGDGNVENPTVMFLGEGPGAEEDNKGIPFIGRAGRKLDEMMSYIGLTRDQSYITNAVLCRPPKNRTPTIAEMDACRWRLHLQLKLIKPKLVILLGKAAVTTWLGREFTGPLTQYFGETLTLEIDGETFTGAAVYHPAYHLRNREGAAKASAPAWKKIKEIVGGE